MDWNAKYLSALLLITPVDQRMMDFQYESMLLSSTIDHMAALKATYLNWKCYDEVYLKTIFCSTKYFKDSLLLNVVVQRWCR